MKRALTLLLLVSSCAVASAQKLQWSIVPPAPTFAYSTSHVSSNNSGQIRALADAAGGGAALVEYSNAGGLAGRRLLWISSTGRLRAAFDVTAPATTEVYLFRIAPTYILLRIGASPTVIRRYELKAGAPLVSDTTLGASDVVPPEAVAESSGFFIFRHAAGNLTSIQRFKK